MRWCRETRRRETITFSVDPIRQEPKIERTVDTSTNVKTGTTITLHWPHVASDIVSDNEDDFLQLAEDFTFLNPHLTLRMNWFGDKTVVKTTNPDWAKWKPHMPTSPHWYPDDQGGRFGLLNCDFFMGMGNG